MLLMRGGGVRRVGCDGHQSAMGDLRKPRRVTVPGAARRRGFSFAGLLDQAASVRVARKATAVTVTKRCDFGRGFLNQATCVSDLSKVTSGEEQCLGLSWNQGTYVSHPGEATTVAMLALSAGMLSWSAGLLESRKCVSDPRKPKTTGRAVWRGEAVSVCRFAR